VVFFGPRVNAKLILKFHVALHASQAALSMVTLKISPYINVTLTSDFGLDRIWISGPDPPGWGGGPHIFFCNPILFAICTSTFS
jgi:hypothetical protein